MNFYYDPPRIAPKDASEVAIQASCKLRIESQFDCMFVAIPNGQKRTRWQAQNAKREGMRKGFQREVLNLLASAGHDVGVFRSQDTLATYMREGGWL